MFLKSAKVLRNKLRYPQAKIHSHAVSKSARVGSSSIIFPDVVLMDECVVGDFSYVNRGTIVGKQVTIGNYSSISFNCMIGLYEHPARFFSTSPFTYGPKAKFPMARDWDEFQNPVSIGSDVWVGASAVILQSVSVGCGAIVGAGAVVTKDVPPYAIVTGVPAKIQSYRFDESRVQSLLDSKWWESDDPGHYGRMFD